MLQHGAWPDIHVRIIGVTFDQFLFVSICILKIYELSKIEIWFLVIENIEIIW